MASAQVRGVLFPPKNGWCTVVPFEGDERKVDELVELFALPVLHYRYAEDHGWGFSMAHPGDIDVRYEAYWDEDAVVHHKELYMALLAPYFLPKVDVQALEHRLRRAAVPTVGQVPLAYEFASALGLPKFKWLSPRYVTLDHKEGSLPKALRVVGEPDPDPVLPQPMLARVEVPRTHFSAMEALDAVRPQILVWDSEVHFDLIGSSGDLKKRGSEGPTVSGDGRLTDHGYWRIRFLSLAKGVIALVSVAQSGDVGIKAMQIDENTRTSQRPPEWLDSTRLAMITEPLYERARKPDGPPLYDRIMRLGPWGPGDRWVWTVMYFCWAKGMARWDLNLVVDATTGEVIDQNEYTA